VRLQKQIDVPVAHILWLDESLNKRYRPALEYNSQTISPLCNDRHHRLHLPQEEYTIVSATQ
jgi:hypothetical protein